MSYASSTAAVRGAQTSGIRPSGGMASSMAANMVGSQYVPPSGWAGMTRALDQNFAPLQYQAPSGSGMGDALAANLDYRQYRAPSGGFDGSAYGMRSFNPSGGMGDALAANLDYRQYRAPSGALSGMGDALAANLRGMQYRRPSGNVARLDGSAYGMRTFQPSGALADGGGTEYPQDLSDILGDDGLWYAQGIRPSGQTDGSGTQHQTAADVAGGVLHQAGDIITETIRSGNALQLEQLRTASAERIAAINANNASISDPLLRAQNEQMAHALQLVSDQAAAAQAARAAPVASTSLNPNFLIGAAVVGAAVLGGIVFMSTRKNPSCGPGCNCSKCRNNPVIGSGRSRHFVPQHELDRRAAKRARRRSE